MPLYLPPPPPAVCKLWAAGDGPAMTCWFASPPFGAWRKKRRYCYHPVLAAVTLRTQLPCRQRRSSSPGSSGAAGVLNMIAAFVSSFRRREFVPQRKRAWKRLPSAFSGSLVTASLASARVWCGYLSACVAGAHASRTAARATRFPRGFAAIASPQRLFASSPFAFRTPYAARIMMFLRCFCLYDLHTTRCV